MINLGILGCAEIAYRRFMPATKNIKDLNVIVVAEEYDTSKLTAFAEEYGVETETSFLNVINRKDIDAVYIPQPPALHYKWAKIALESGKHVLVEKPSTISYEDSKDLVNIAKKTKLALHENYMFQYHSQIEKIINLIDEGTIGEPRLYRANFGFPLRQANDFRYNKILGGGALIDAGGYTAKLATLLLGESIKVETAKFNYIDGYEVDMFGSASFVNDDGQVCQVSYGMDCFYQCSLEAWGNKGKLLTDRIFTAPPGYCPSVIVDTKDGRQEIRLEADSHFEKSILEFLQEIECDEKREKMYKEVIRQAKLLETMGRYR